jgi:hypothetical protein
MDRSLVRNDDGTFPVMTHSHPADIHFMAPVLRFSFRPFRMWLEGIVAQNDNIKGTMGIGLSV